jgi:putative PIN family toxin of toxin-antitoxin system
MRGVRLLIRVVLDSNILISAFFWDGDQRSILRDCREGKLHLVLSDFIFEEVDRILQDKFGVEEHLTRSYIREIFRFSEIVMTKGVIDIIDEDPSDNRILETAVIGKVDLLITGDKHLLKVGEYRGIQIVRSSELSK